MTKKLLVIGALIAGIVLLLTTLAWFFTPFGFSKIGFGYNSAWIALSWSRMLLPGLTRQMFWILPALLLAWLVSASFQPGELQEIKNSTQVGES